MKKPFFSLRRVAFGLVLAAIAVACGDATGPKTEPVASLDISGIPATLYVGNTATLAATPRDADGAVLANRPVTWTSSDTTVAGVSAQGVVTGRKAGDVVIVATSEQASATATLRVTLEPPAVVEITGGPAAPVVAGTSVQLAAVARNAAGAAIPGRIITWTSANPQLATVSDSGRVQTLGAGEVVITAANEGVGTSVTLRIVERVVAVEIVGGPATPVLTGSAVQLNAVARSAAGAALSGRLVTWSSGNPELATVSPVGTVQALRAGQVEITATVEGVDAVLVLQILDRVVSVEIVGGPAEPLAAGAAVQLNAVARSASGVALSGRPVAWSSGNPALATISSGGMVQTLLPGEVEITATVEGVSTAFTLRIVERVVSVHIVGGPGMPVLTGSTVQLTAVARSAAGTALSGRSVTWSSGNVEMATVSAGGAVQTLRAGQAEITATVEGVSATLVLYVLEPVGALQITGAPAGPVTVGMGVQLTAVARGADGTELPGRMITWSSGNTALATVGGGGYVMTHGAGEVTIMATHEGVSATVILRILEPVASVQVTGAPAGPVLRGAEVQLAAVPRSAAGAALAGRAVTWRSSDPAVASVSAEGLVRALVPGYAYITATVGGISQTVTLYVLEPVAAVAITGAPTAPVVAGPSFQLSAVARGAAGEALTGRAVTWTSSNPDVAPVSPGGTLQTLRGGEAVITATVEGVRATVTLIVLEPVFAVQIVGAPAAPVVAGATVQLRAVTRSAAGDSLGSRAVSWFSSDEYRATISANGLVTTRSVGSVRITASVEGRWDSFVLQILEPVASVSVAAPVAGVYQGQTVQLAATLRDASGNCWRTAPSPGPPPTRPGPRSIPPAG